MSTNSEIKAKVLAEYSVPVMHSVAKCSRELWPVSSPPGGEQLMIVVEFQEETLLLNAEEALALAKAIRACAKG